MASSTLTESLRDTLALFDEGGTPWTTTEIAARLDLGRRSTYERLERLVEHGWLETKKVGASARVWWLPPASSIPAHFHDSQHRPTAGESTGDDEWEAVRSAGSVHADTECKEDERELEQYKRMVETVGDGIYVLDSDQRFVMVNSGFASMTGYDHDELIGSRAETTFSEEFVEFANEKQAELESRKTDIAVLEEDLYRADGTSLVVESQFAPLDFDTGETGRVGVVRDVNDRVEHERELEAYRRWNQTLVENFPSGAIAVVDENFRYITFGGTPEGDADVTRTDLEGAPVRDVLPKEIADVVIPHYEAALEGEPAEFEDAIGDRVYQFHFVPVRDDEGTVFAATAMSQDITDHVNRERELERQRERLTALDEINSLFRDITDAVIEQSSREEIESIVCERLAESDSYMFAWIGDIDMHTQTLQLRTEAGVEGYLDGITITVDPEKHSEGATTKAVIDREIQTTQDVKIGNTAGSWRAAIEKYGFRSSAAIPIVHSGVIYGVLNVYAERPDAFTDDEQAVIGKLGEVIGHAIAAIEGKRALVSDEVIELEFQRPSLFDAVELPGSIDGTITLDRTVPIGDGAYLEYGTATGNAMEAVEAIVASATVPHWTAVTVLSTGGDETRIEITLTEPPVVETVAAYGGYVDESRIEDGNHTMKVHLAPGADVRHITDAIKRANPTIELITRRQITRDEATSVQLKQTLYEDLTDRQRTALEAAFYAGFFEWPREMSGEEVAASIGISSPTFHQHLRKAQQKVFESLLSSPTPS